MRVLIENIGILAGIDSHGKQRLCGKEMQSLGILNDAWLLVEDGRFAAWGTRAEMPVEGIAADEHVDAEGGAVLP